MVKNTLSKMMTAISLFVLYAVPIAALLAFAINVLAGPLANYVLANNIADPSREFPPTAYSVPQTSGDVRLIGGRGDGLSCSIPGWLEFLAFPTDNGAAPPSLQNRQACIFHDYCYRHGHATYGYTQNDCDQFLQNHSFKLCRYTSQAKRNTQERCQTRARLVTLGVIFGGSKSFRIDDSTYFEFDARPFRSRAHTVYRVADTPTCWVKAGAMPRSVYHFNVRPSGTLVEILGLPKDDSKQAGCFRRFQIPGHYNRYLPAPVVAKVGGEDWFVWWRRTTTTDRKGKLSFLAPRRASVWDWRKVNGLKTVPDGTGNDMTLENPAYVDLLHRPKDGKETMETEGNWNTSEFHLRRWSPKNNKKLQLTGVLTHTCMKEVPKDEKQRIACDTLDLKGPRNDTAPDRFSFSQNILCYRNLEIDLELSRPIYGKKERDALALRGGPRKAVKIRCPGGTATFSAKELTAKYNLQRPSDRYRSLVNPPLDMQQEGRHYIGLTRRGDERGNNYSTELTMRRYGHISSHRLVKHVFALPSKHRKRLLKALKISSNTGQSFGRVRFRDHEEMDEPVVYLGGQQAHSSLVLSLRSDHRETGLWNAIKNRLGFQPEPIKLAFWEVPKLNDWDEPLGLEKSLDEVVRIALELQVVGTETFSSEYFRQPPVLVNGSSTKSDLYFWKIDTHNPGHLSIARISINTQSLKSKAKTAKTSKEKTVKIDVNFHSLQLCGHLIKARESSDKCPSATSSLSLNAADMNGDDSDELLIVSRTPEHTSIHTIEPNSIFD